MSKEKQEVKSVNFGQRFYEATLYIVKNFSIKRYELAAEMGIDNATLSRWINWQTFKPQQHLKQEKLRKYGINPLYFREPDSEMILPGQEVGFEAEIVKAFIETGEAIKEQEDDLKQIVSLLKKILEADKQNKIVLATIQNEIEAMKKNQRVPR